MANTAKKILIIEDDPFLNEMYVTKFTQANFEVEVAIDGQEGLQKIEKNKPDLILLDIVLPKMDGFEILTKMKANTELKDIPVILLTNLSQRDEVKRGLDLGANDYLIKAHFMPSEVIKKIKTLLGE